MPTLLIRHPDGSESEQELAGELTVGRAEGNDVILAEGGVSRRHARIFMDAGQIFVEDTGSANGTFVDGLKIEGATELATRSQLVIGEYEISLKSAGAAKGTRGPSKPRAGPNGSEALGEGGVRQTVQRPVLKAARSTRVVPNLKDASPAQPGALAKRAPRQAGAAPPTGPTLRGLTGPWANKLFPLRGKVTVGRVPGVQIQLDDDSVSRRHAEVEVTPAGLILRDLESANGTLVNGAPAEGDVELQPGDIIQFGVVELTVEAPQSALSAPTRRPRRSGEREAAGPLSARKKLLVLGGGGLMTLILIAVAVRALSHGPVVQPPPPRGATASASEGGELQELLSQCRSYSAPELVEPDWRRAEGACEKALDIEPINPEANQLIKKIKREKISADHYDKGQKALHRLHEDDAIDEFSKIPKDSFYYAKVKSQIQDVAEAARKRAGDDCRKYASSAFWTEAVERCGRYMFFACQTMAATDLMPPPGFVTKAPGRAKKGEWWPKDPMFQRLLTAIAKVPNSKSWKCEYAPILAADQGPPPAELEVRKWIEGRFPDKAIAMSVLDYWRGRTQQSTVQLNKILEDTEKAQLHVQANQLKKQIFTADGLYTEGEAALQKDDIEDAARSFQEVEQIDKDLLKDVAEQKPSFFRHNIQNDMAAKAYERGKFYADREDKKRACKMWKLGFGFFKGNTDLNRATGNCSTWSQRTLEGAQTCEDLDRAVEFAVDGDGLKEKAADQRVALKCPTPTSK